MTWKPTDQPPTEMFLFFMLIVGSIIIYPYFFAPNRPWYEVDGCDFIPGTPGYERTHPAPCPYTEINGKCALPKKKKS